VFVKRGLKAKIQNAIMNVIDISWIRDHRVMTGLKKRIRLATTLPTQNIYRTYGGGNGDSNSNDFVPSPWHYEDVSCSS
jgi:hypothetical protein